MYLGGDNLKLKSTFKFLIFFISLGIFYILIRLGYALGISSDELNTSPSVILNGDFNLYLSWFMLLLAFILTIISFINLLLGLKK